MANALDNLPGAQPAEQIADPFSDSFFQEPGIGQKAPPKQAINRVKAADLSARGIPTYKDASGDVAPVKDESGAPLTGLSAKTGIAYDSQGSPKQISYGDEGAPTLSDPFDKIPSTTDPKTGAVEKYGPGGIYQYLGQDPDVTSRIAQKASDKDLSKESGLLGRKLSLDEHDLVQANKQQKVLHTELTGAVPSLLDPKFHGADPDTVHKAIDDHFDEQYAAPEANAKGGFFGGGDLTPEAQALRSNIDAQKAKAHDTADQVFGLNDKLNQLHDNVQTGRDQQRAHVETLLAHEQGKAGPLDQPQPGAGAAPAGKLYPDEKDWPRMLGGAPPTEAQQSVPRMGADDLAKPFATGEKSYRVGDDNSFHLDPNNMVKGVRQAMTDGLIDQGKAKDMLGKVKPIQDAIDQRNQLIKDAGGYSQVKAFGHGAAIGAGFLAAAEPGAAVGAEIGAAGGPIGVAAGGAIGGLITGSVGAWAVKKAIDKLGEYDDRIKTLSASADLHPITDAAGQFVALAASAPKAIGNMVKLGRTAAQSVSDLGVAAQTTEAVKTVGKFMGVQGLTGAAFGGIVLPAFDKARYAAADAMGISHDQFQSPTAKSILSQAALGILVGGNSIRFKDYSAADVASVLFRARARNEAGIGLDTNDPGAVAAAFDKAGFKMDSQQSQKASTPLSPNEINLYNALKTKVARMQESGAFDEATGVKFASGTQAQVRGILGKEGPPIVSAGVEATRTEPAGGKGGASEPPAKPGGAPKQLPGGGEANESATQGGISPTAKGGKVSGASASESARPESKGAQPDNANAPAKAAAESPAAAGTATESGRQPVLTRLPEPRTMKDSAIESELNGIGYQVHRMPGEEFSLSRGDQDGVAPKEARAVSLAEELGARHEADQTKSSRPKGAPPVEGRPEIQTIDVAAHKAATSPKNGLAEPTQAQKEAGNYQKGHVTVGGLDVSIENPAGSKRKPEYAPLQSHYGYIKGTVGADKDHVDVFVKQGTPKDYSGPVYVVNQHDKSGKFDEHKAVIGVSSPEAARSEYLGNYQKGWTGGKSVVQFDNPAAFKKWAESGAKGKPAIDPRLPASFAKVAAHLHLTYEGPSSSGQLRFSTPTGDRIFLSEPDAKLLLAKTQKKAQGGEREPGKSEGESSEKPSAGQEAGGLVGKQREGSSRVSSGQQGEQTRIATPDEARAGLEKSKQVHAAEIAALGVKHVERSLGRAGIAMERDGSAIAVDHKALAEAAAIVHGKGGDSQNWIEDAHKEELIHFRDLQASGNTFNLVHSKIWGALAPEAKEAVRGLYKDTTTITHLAAEYIRMVAQFRADGRITEDNHDSKNTDKIIPFLEGKQSDALEAHLEKMANVAEPSLLAKLKEKLAAQEKTGAVDDRLLQQIKDLEKPAKPQTPQIPPLGGKYVLPSFVTGGPKTKLGIRANQLYDRLSSLEGVSPTEGTLVMTLLRSGTGKALDQAESKIAKLEDKYATTTGKQPSSEGEQLPRVPTRKDVRENAPEIREEEGAKADAGSGPVKRGSSSGEEPSVRPSGQLDAKANKALDEAVEGLFAGKPIRPGSEWTWPEPTSDDDFANMIQPHAVGIKAGLRLGPEDVAAVQKEYDQAAKDMMEAARTASPRFKALFGKHTYLGGKLEGAKRQGPNYDAYISRNEPLGAGMPQEAIPVDKLPKVITAAQELIRQGIDTPEKLASVLEEKFAGKARPFSQAFWDAIGIVRPDLRGTHDWATIYGALAPDKKVKVRTPAENVTHAVGNLLRTGQTVDRRALTKLAEGNGVATKEADEAAELAVVQVAREIVGKRGTPEEKFNQLVDLYNRQPNLTAKTSTSKVDQAYSTPAPLAFAASNLVDIGGGKTIFEPTAGNGMLLIEADPKRQEVVANEINGHRAEALHSQGFKVSANDAANWSPGGKAAPGEFDRVIANPPFGTVLDANGNNKTWPMWESATNQIDFAIAAKSLNAMGDNGRAVLILGGKNIQDPEERAKAYARQDFWPKLYEKYKVVDHFTVDGDLYSKQGAGWPVDVITIAGRGKSQIQLPSADAPRILGSWNGLRAELSRTDAERVEAGRYNAQRDRERLGGVVSDLEGIAATEQRIGPQGDSKPTDTEHGSRGSVPSAAGPSQESQPLAERHEPQESDGTAAERAGSVGTGSARAEPEQRGPLGQFRVPYKPASKFDSFGIFIPTNMEGPAREALAKLQERVGDIDKFVSQKLGYRADAPIQKYFSAEQMDALALGIDAIDGQTAFILGDQGGVGKGRVAAGMMRYAIKAGKTPIFVTKDPKLYAAMIEDLHDIGSDDITPLFTNNELEFEDYAGKKWSQDDMRETMEEIARTGKLPTGADVLFTTYDQIQSDKPKGFKPSKAERAGMKASHLAPPDGPKMDALKKLAHGSIIIADESHLASGDSIRAWRLAPLLAQASGVYYSSATFAKRPDSLGIYSRTSLSHATQSMSDLVDAMKQGGVPLQQVVSATLASDGLYMRRERDFSHAVFRTHINTETRDRDVKLADNYTEGLRTILSISNKMKEASKKLNKILRRQGKEMHVDNAPRIETTNFSSKLHNLVSQYLYAIKAESLVRRTIEGVTKGFTNAEGKTVPHRVIIAVQNTMEQAILDLDRSGRPFSFNGLLLRYLDSQRTLKSGRGPSAQTITITDKGDEEFEGFSDKQLQDAIIVPNPTNPEEAGVNEKALAELFRRIMAGVFKEAEEKLEGLDLANMPVSPIDHIRQQLTKAGVQNAEITGRGVGLDEDGLVYHVSPSAKTKAAQLRYLNDFNNGPTQALVINASASTGISAHASEKFKNQDPRAMLIGQPNLDINEFVQTLYRIDRTGQVAQPYYELVQTALSAELRPAAILGRKMGSLNANTTSNAENEISTGNKGVDIFNQYGDEVVYSYLRSDPAFTEMLDMPKIMTGETLGAIEDVLGQYEQDGQFAAAVSGRVAVLLNDEASAFWDKVQSDYAALIGYLNEIGGNELLADTIDLRAETEESKELTPAVKGAGRPSGFDQPSRLEKIRADIGSKPLPGSEVLTEMNKLGADAHETVLKWADQVEAWKEKELARLAEKVVGWNDVKEASTESRWRHQEEEIRQALGLIGSGLHLKDKTFEGYGAISEVKFDDDQPLTPSKQIFTVLVNTTKKTLKIAASKLPSIARYAVGDFEKLYESTAERSNTRYMVTGNLLSAYLAIRDSAPTAKIVQYTTDKGELRQGILMPSKFTPGALAKKRVVESPSHMRELLDAGRSLTNSDGSVTIVKPRGDYVLRVPASKTMGGAYWRDEGLQKLMEGGQFIERSGGMVGKITPDNLAKVYQRLLDLDATLFYTEQESEPLGAGKPHKAPTAFYKEDVESVARNIGLGVKESLEMLRHLVAPASGVNMEARDATMKMLGERNQKAYETDQVLEGWSKAVDKMPRPEQIAFVDRMKLGQPQPTPELQDLADTLRSIDTESWQGAHDAYVALGHKQGDVPLAWLDNHFRVLWKKIPGDTDEEKSAWIGKARRGLRGSMGQHKEHTLDTMSEGVAAGGVPYSFNFVEMFKLAQADLWKLTTTLKAWKWAKDNHFVQYVKGAFPKAPDDMVPLDDSIAKVYFPADSGEGLVAGGQYFVEEGFGRLLNNYLSKDLIRDAKLGRGLIWLKNATTQVELALSPFHAVFETIETVGSNIGLGLQKLVNRGILGGNAKVAFEGLMEMAKAIGTPITHGLGKNSLGAQIREAAGNPTEFFKTPEGKKMLKAFPRAPEMINDLFSGGWKPTELEQDWRNQSVRTFVEAVSDLKAGASDNYIGAGLRAFPAANEMLMRPLFDYYIPNLKVAQFFKEYAEALEQNERKLKGGVLTRAALARQTWRFVEDRFGEMNYDSLFWNRTFKSAMQLMFRSVTWKLGSVSAFGGAMHGQGKEFVDAFKEGRAPQLNPKMAWLFGMLLLTAALGTILMKSLTGKWPTGYTDLVFPQIDAKDDKIRVSLPTYFKDLVHLIHSPTSYVTSSMSGWIGRVADLRRNRDYYGVQIHDNDDPVVKQALAIGKYASQTLLPFSIRGYKNLSAQDVGTLRKAISLMGVQPAPRFIGQSPAERASASYWQNQRSEAGIKPGQMETKLEKREIVSQLEHGHAPNIAAALAKGAIRPQDVKALYQRAQMGTLASQVLHMPLEDAEKIYQRANLKERTALEGIMAKKRANAATRNRPAFSGF
jgi:predicted RNA methylase